MKWTVTLTAEMAPGDVRTHELGQIEREDTITPASLGLSIAEGKTLVAALQTAMVTAQVERHGEALQPCPHCAQPRTTKGYYTSIFRSVFGQVSMRVRRLRPCRREETARASVSVLPTRQRPNAPELLYLVAKLAALMPCGKVAMFLEEVLPTASQTHASTVRNYTHASANDWSATTTPCRRRCLAPPLVKSCWAWTAAMCGADSRVLNGPLRLWPVRC